MKEVVLQSGSVLRIGDIPFDTANNLKKAVMRQIQGIPIQSSKQLIDLYKDYLCAAFASNEVETCLWECMKRCTYNNGSGNLKIEKTSFESQVGREDFTEIQIEVGQESLLPFSKPLFAALQRMLATGAENFPASK